MVANTGSGDLILRPEHDPVNNITTVNGGTPQITGLLDTDALAMTAGTLTIGAGGTVQEIYRRLSGELSST